MIEQLVVQSLSIEALDQPYISEDHGSTRKVVSYRFSRVSCPSLWLAAALDVVLHGWLWLIALNRFLHPLYSWPSEALLSLCLSYMSSSSSWCPLHDKDVATCSKRLTSGPERAHVLVV